jgi:hypothetical protein
MRPTRILVTGSRTWDDFPTIAKAVREQLPDEGWEGQDFVVVHGGANGADTLADRAARFWGVAIEVHYPSWNTYGRKAGPLRNQRMVDLGASICLAFIQDESRGATDCLKRAEKAGILVMVYRRTSSQNNQTEQ